MISRKSLPIHPDFVAGEAILIDKELDWTSFDVVNSIRIFLKKHYGLAKLKVGHAGTLDPRATGLMIVCTGKQTRQISHYQNSDKEYTGTIMLGSTTPSWDTETEPDAVFPIDHITPEMIHDAARQLTGTIIQYPPAFSAVKVDGTRAYKIARDNGIPALKPRQVHVSFFEITRIELPVVAFKVRCSKGTYVRSLAYDFGKLLHSGAYLLTLCRTAIGEYRLDDALTLEEFKNYCRNLQTPSIQK